MEIIEINGNTFLVDLARTRAYYTSNEICDCADCRRFQSVVRANYPKLAEFFERFGIDISHPDETGSIDAEDRIEYSFAGYTVCGSILRLTNETITVIDSAPLTVYFDKGFAFPNGQTGDYFSIIVGGISLVRNQEDA